MSADDWKAMRAEAEADLNAIYAQEPWGKLAIECGFNPYNTESMAREAFRLCAEKLAAQAEREKVRAERIAVLEGALEAIKSDAVHVIDFYNRNGPTWTGKDGHEYDDMSSVLGRAETVIQQIDSALRGEA